MRMSYYACFDEPSYAGCIVGETGNAFNQLTS